MATAYEKAWLAGLFEGEGCFRLTSVTRRGRTWTYAHASIVSTDKDVIDRVIAITGCGRTYVEHRGPPRKPLHSWVAASRDDFATFAQMVRPWLCKRRAKKLADVEAATTTTRRLPGPKATCKRGHPLTPANRKPNGKGKTTCRVCAVTPTGNRS